MTDESILDLCDDTKKAIRDNTMVAGFMTLFVFTLLLSIAFANGKSLDSLLAGMSLVIRVIFFAIMMACGTILALLHKRDLTAMTFIVFAISMLLPQLTATLHGITDLVSFSPYFIILSIVSIAFLFTDDEQRVIAFLLMFTSTCPWWIMLATGEVNYTLLSVAYSIVTVMCAYSFLCIGLENPKFPFYRKLTADLENASNDGIPVDFKISGALLGYTLFATPMLASVMYYAGVKSVTINTVFGMESSCGLMLMVVGVVMLLAGRMKYTPFMFMMLGSVMILTWYIKDVGQVSFIIMLLIGIITIFRANDRKILSGVTIILYGCTYLISAMFGGVTNAGLSLLLNFIPLALCMYIAVALCYKEKLPLI